MKTIVEVFTGILRVKNGIQTPLVQQKVLVGAHSKYAIKKRFGGNVQGFWGENRQGEVVKPYTLINPKAQGVNITAIHRLK